MGNMIGTLERLLADITANREILESAMNFSPHCDDTSYKLDNESPRCCEHYLLATYFSMWCLRNEF